MSALSVTVPPPLEHAENAPVHVPDIQKITGNKERQPFSFIKCCKVRVLTELKCDFVNNTICGIVYMSA